MNLAVTYASKGRQNVYKVLRLEMRREMLGLVLKSNSNVHGDIWVMWRPNHLNIQQECNVQRDLLPLLGSVDSIEYPLRPRLSIW